MMNDERRLKDSMEVIEKVCFQYRGTFQEHQAIQTSLNNIKLVLFPAKKVEVKPKEAKK